MSPSADDPSLLTEFTLTRRVVLEWTGLGTAATVLAATAFATLYGVGTGRADVGFQVGSADAALVGFGLAALSIVGVIVVHEAIHAAVLRWYGTDVSYGLGVAGFVLPYAYVTTTQRLTRNQFVAVALAPLVVVTLVGVPLMIALDTPALILPLAVNAGGAIGDVWMVAILGRYPSHVVVEDSKTGLRIYGTPVDDPLRPATTRAFLRRIAYGTAVGFFAITIGGVAVGILLVLVGFETFTVGVPETAWTVYAVERGPGGASASVNAVGVAAVSVAQGFGYAIATTPRTRR